MIRAFLLLLAVLSYWTPQSVVQKAVCPICKGHSRFDECSCHYEGITA